MNTIPLIFNQHQINRTTLGGKEQVPSDYASSMMNVGVILLNSIWSPYRAQMIENFLRCGFSQIVSFEKNPENYNIEDFSHRFPFVKFIVPLEDCTDGDLINIGASELSTEYFLVLRDSLDFSMDILSPTLAAKLTEDKPFCVTPRLVSNQNEAFPILFSPSIRKTSMTVDSTSLVSDGSHNLYPFDYIGLYNRVKFINSGGFDYTILSSYWQNLDLSFRAWLWGEKIILSTSFSLSYSDEVPAEDSTPSQYSNRFYLKNLLPRFSADHGIVKKTSFFPFFISSSCGFFEALDQFAEAKEWISKNKYRFKRDALDLVENWGKK